MPTIEVNFAELQAAADQALKLGVGYVRLTPDGRMSFVDARTVQLHPDPTPEAAAYGGGFDPYNQ